MGGRGGAGPAGSLQSAIGTGAGEGGATVSVPGTSTAGQGVGGGDSGHGVGCGVSGHGVHGAGETPLIGTEVLPCEALGLPTRIWSSIFAAASSRIFSTIRPLPSTSSPTVASQPSRSRCPSMFDAASAAATPAHRSRLTLQQLVSTLRPASAEAARLPSRCPLHGRRHRSASPPEAQAQVTNATAWRQSSAVQSSAVCAP